MKPYFEAILAEEQARFRPGRSTVEQVFALKMLIQHRIEKKDGKVFAVFINYKKVFDRVKAWCTVISTNYYVNLKQTVW